MAEDDFHLGRQCGVLPETELPRHFEPLHPARTHFRRHVHFDADLDPETTHEYHYENLPADGAKVAHFCSVCGPKFCSIKITQEVREYAAKKRLGEEATLAKGLKAKASRFNKGGSEIYVKED